MAAYLSIGDQCSLVFPGHGPVEDRPVLLVAVMIDGLLLPGVDGRIVQSAHLLLLLAVLPPTREIRQFVGVYLLW